MHQLVGDTQAPSWYSRFVSVTDERVILAMKLRCGIYRRISNDPEGRELGIDRQLEDCQARADREDWTVHQIYTDNDLSASTRSRKDRPGYAELLAAAERGEIQVILAYSNSRLTRRPAELEALVALHDRTKVRICTVVSGDTNLATADGRVIARTLAAFDAGEAERTAERVSRACQARAQAGRWHGRRCVGYLASGELEPREAAAVRAGVESIIAGSSLHEVARRWDQAGLVRHRGGSWLKQLTKLKQVLTSYRIAGIPVHQDNPLFDVEVQWPAIVTRQDLERVRDILLDPSRRTNGARAARRSLLSGLAVCARCGAPLRSSTHEGGRPNRSTSRVQIYRCSGVRCGLLIRSWLLDEPVVEATLAELLVADLAALAPDEQDRLRMGQLRDELEHVDKAQREVVSWLSERLLTAAQARESLQQLLARHAAAQAELAGISARFAPAAFVQRSRDLLLLTDEERDARADQVVERFHELDLNQRRSIISVMVTIIVHPGHSNDRVDIHSRATGKRITPDDMQLVRFADPSGK